MVPPFEKTGLNAGLLREIRRQHLRRAVHYVELLAIQPHEVRWIEASPDCETAAHVPGRVMVPPCGSRFRCCADTIHRPDADIRVRLCRHTYRGARLWTRA